MFFLLVSRNRRIEINDTEEACISVDIERKQEKAKGKENRIKEREDGPPTQALAGSELGFLFFEVPREREEVSRKSSNGFFRHAKRKKNTSFFDKSILTEKKRLMAKRKKNLLDEKEKNDQ